MGYKLSEGIYSTGQPEQEYPHDYDSVGLCGRMLSLSTLANSGITYIACYANDEDEVHHAERGDIEIDAQPPLPECMACICNICQKLVTSKPELLESFQ